MSFKRNKYRLTNSIEVVEYHTARYGAPGQPRSGRTQQTPEAVAKNNQRRKERQCSRMVDKYFNDDDYVLTLTYRVEDRPKDMDECKKHLQKFFRKIKKEYAKRFYDLFWIRNIEVGPRNAWHVHVIMNRIEGADFLIREQWPFGGVFFQFFKNKKAEGEDLGKYMAKSAVSAPDKVSDSSWSHSRNVQPVEPETTVISGQSMNDKPRTPKGYYLDKSSYRDYVNAEGYKIREYTFRRLDPVRVDHRIKRKRKRRSNENSKGNNLSVQRSRR